MATNPINLWNASEADLKSLDSIGQAKARRIIQLRERKEDFNFEDVADVTQTEQSKWIAWSNAGMVCIKKLETESSVNPPAQEISDIMSTKELHSTLLEMNKSIKLRHDEVQFLRTEVVLKSEVDESVYKTPTALASELEVAKESLDNTLTISASKDKATTELADKGADQKLIIDRLTSFPRQASSLIHSREQSLKQVHPSIGYWRMLISKPFLQYSQILNTLKSPMHIPKDWCAMKNQPLKNN